MLLKLGVILVTSDFLLATPALTLKLFSLWTLGPDLVNIPEIFAGKDVAYVNVNLLIKNETKPTRTAPCSFCQ